MAIGDEKVSGTHISPCGFETLGLLTSSIHVLMHGPPGTAKSSLGMWCVHRLGIGSATHRASDVGLTGAQICLA